MSQENLSGQISGMQSDDSKPKTEYEQVAEIISDIDRRLRTLEERYSTMRKKLQLSDQNMIESERSFNKEFRHADDELLQLKKSMNDFGDKILLFESELESNAKKIDLKVIEKYLMLWSPQNYVTKTELRDYLERRGLIDKVKSEDLDETD